MSKVKEDGMQGKGPVMVKVDEEQVRGHLDLMVKTTVEQALKGLLELEAKDRSGTAGWSSP